MTVSCCLSESLLARGSLDFVDNCERYSQSRPPQYFANRAKAANQPTTMTLIHACELPDDALLRRYRGSGAYADCYVTELARPVSQAEFVEAFYTTAVFKLERLLLAWFAARPSSDSQAAQLASGGLGSFAAWSVEARAPDQLLLSDFQGRTRSWLMSAPAPNGRTTRLFFGSAVVPIVDRHSGATRMGATYRALLGFHKLYSRLLLRAAATRLARRSG